MYSNRLKNINVKKVSVVKKYKLKILKWYNVANSQNKTIHLMKSQQYFKLVKIGLDCLFNFHSLALEKIYKYNRRLVCWGN